MKPIPFGRYLLLDRLAIGGMAEVYVATERDERGGRLYAVKRMLPSLAEDEEFVSMFLDEARIVAQLAHPGVVAVHDLGKHGDAYYIASEYVPGKDLRAVMKRTRRMGERIPVPLAAYLGFRVADALDYAHRKRDAQGHELRVVHRDVSPANVLVGFDGSVRIIDFGIAQAAFRTRREETVLRGKFGYMSPEAASGDAVDRRSDVFALGVVLHEVLTGVRLFTGPTELAVLERVRSGEIPPPSRLNPAVPPGLDAVVLRALARDVHERWAWASELRDALAPWVLAGTPAGDPPALARFMARQFPGELRTELDRVERLQAPLPDDDVEVLDVVAPPEPDATVIAPPEVVFRERRSRWKGAVAGVVVLLLLAGSAVFALARAREAAPQTGARIVVQPLGTARLVVDGKVHPPDLAPGEVRSVEVDAGLHRVELVTEAGRTAATVDVGPGETAELLRVELR